MQHDATYRPAPPPPLPKRLNAVLRLYDAPLYRDWAFWHTVGWGLVAGISIPTTPPAEPSPLPLWLDTLLAILIMVVTFGVVPAWLRLLVRRWWWHKHQRPHRNGVARSESPTAQGSASATPESQYQQPQTGVVRSSITEQTPSRSTASSLQSDSISRRTFQPAASNWNHGSESREGADNHAEVNRAGWSNELLTHARNTMPHPVARAARTLQQAHTPKDQYEALLDTAETLAITISVTAAALLQGQAEFGTNNPQRGRGYGHRNLCMLRKAYLGRGAMFGTWTVWLNDLKPLVATHPNLVPGLLDAFQDKPDDPGIMEHLNALREERNRAAHGDKPKSQAESALRLSECGPHLESALARAKFLRDTPWLFIVSCVYQPRLRSFHIVADDAMGDHPDFERRTFTWGSPVGNEIFYALGSAGPVSLSPFVANLFCPKCQQVEVCYAYKIIQRRSIAVFKSFGRGHEIISPEMGDELQSLPDQQPSGNA